ncbi:MAG: methylmalonyl Co-A mutase-associated GTPase MeaB [SAR324 cluster bacterium]|nr:methylmalonyl Co-A mutase-associated GTPase MeaB [SAR324 cluster bacterium]
MSLTLSISEAVDQIRQGNRRTLAKTITLLESTVESHVEQGQAILDALLPYTGKSVRLGITGVPGVGKSTFIESFGLYLIENGFRVAVLAVDPSSPITGGSIMGDKTRMVDLSRNPRAFIRPTPSSCTLGGVARKTREAMLVCEAAGYDVILVETVGVGQSETLVASMVDMFLVLMLPNAGDELQGIKKGILEMADLILVNKADGDYLAKAQLAKRDYSNALRLVHPRKAMWNPEVLLCSALQRMGFDELWTSIKKYRVQLTDAGVWEQQRQNQAYDWMWSLVEEELQRQFHKHPAVRNLLPSVEHSVRNDHLLPTVAAAQLLKAWRGE